jgi:CRP/FNR family transcriptional regulator, nitrogen fixation regulation protein
MLVHKGIAALSPAIILDLHPELAPLENAIRHAPIHRLRAGDAVFAQGDPVKGLYLVEFGSVRLCWVTPQGRRYVDFHFAGEIFGFERNCTYLYAAEALEYSGVRKLRIGDLDRSPAVMDLLLADLSRLQQHLLVLGTRNALERVAAFLVDIAERQSANTIVRLPMSRSEIADHLGLTLETVSRAMHRLGEMDLIALNGARTVRLRDKQALAVLGD